MSGYDKLIYCQKCLGFQPHNIGGNGKWAVCMGCGNEVGLYKKHVEAELCKSGDRERRV